MTPSPPGMNDRRRDQARLSPSYARGFFAATGAVKKKLIIATKEIDGFKAQPERRPPDVRLYKAAEFFMRWYFTGTPPAAISGPSTLALAKTAAGASWAQLDPGLCAVAARMPCSRRYSSQWIWLNRN